VYRRHEDEAPLTKSCLLAPRCLDWHPIRALGAAPRPLYLTYPVRAPASPALPLESPPAPRQHAGKHDPRIRSLRTLLSLTRPAAVLPQDGISKPRRLLLAGALASARSHSGAIVGSAYGEFCPVSYITRSRSLPAASLPLTACRGWSRELRCQPPGRPSFVVSVGSAVRWRWQGGPRLGSCPSLPFFPSLLPRVPFGTLRVSVYVPVLFRFLFFCQPPSNQNPVGE